MDKGRQRAFSERSRKRRRMREMREKKAQERTKQWDGIFKTEAAKERRIGDTQGIIKNRRMVRRQPGRQ